MADCGVCDTSPGESPALAVGQGRRRRRPRAPRPSWRRRRGGSVTSPPRVLRGKPQIPRGIGRGRRSCVACLLGPRLGCSTGQGDQWIQMMVGGGELRLRLGGARQSDRCGCRSGGSGFRLALRSSPPCWVSVMVARVAWPLTHFGVWPWGRCGCRSGGSGFALRLPPLCWCRLWFARAT